MRKQTTDEQWEWVATFQLMKLMLFGGARAQQLREITASIKVMMLRAELERTTSKPRESTPEDRRHLVDRGVGIDPDTCRRISVFDPADIKNPIRQ